ncbi:MAG: transcriptional regulator [Gammaproteobacteria bacterium]|nr:MAG: transcriptional regulator [Gammaproteobacteria bacterium]
MRRTDRLFHIIQTLRQHHQPMTGMALAERLEVSLRTLYRDIAELQLQGVPIRGEAGIGYVLDAGYDLPPLMLSANELEAAVLGARWVAGRGDPALQAAAASLLGKIEAVIPEALRPIITQSALRVLDAGALENDLIDADQLRTAMRLCRKVRIRYRALSNDAITERTIWPFLLGYFDKVKVIAAWCELRDDFRHFRTDRVESLQVLDDCYPEHPEALRKRWEAIDRLNYPRRRACSGSSGSPCR